MDSDKVITGQRVDRAKLEIARSLRRGMTDAEQMLWQQLRRNQLLGLHFRRQQVIMGFVVDFHCHQARLVVEVDGGVHAGQVEYDAERDRELKRLGLRVLRVGNEEVRADLPGVLERIGRAART